MALRPRQALSNARRVALVLNCKGSLPAGALGRKADGWWPRLRSRANWCCYKSPIRVARVWSTYSKSGSRRVLRASETTILFERAVTEPPVKSVTAGSESLREESQRSQRIATASSSQIFRELYISLSNTYSLSHNHARANIEGMRNIERGFGLDRTAFVFNQARKRVCFIAMRSLGPGILRPKLRLRSFRAVQPGMQLLLNSAVASSWGNAPPLQAKVVRDRFCKRTKLAQTQSSPSPVATSRQSTASSGCVHCGPAGRRRWPCRWPANAMPDACPPQRPGGWPAGRGAIS